MNKKKLLIAGGILLIILIICVIVFLVIKNKSNNVTNEVKFDKTVASTITMDVNPSIKVEVNKNNKVINVLALNEDAKTLSDDLKEKDVNEVIKTLTTRLITVGYFKNDATIIMNVEGTLEADNIRNTIVNVLNKENIEVNIIEPVITESSKKIAEDLGITPAKASYLEEVISKNPDVKIEDIKDKSVKEIEEVTKENTDKNEDATNNTTTNNNNNNNNKPSGGNSLQKCEKITEALNNEEAGKKAASLQGATVGTGSYCDILPPESVLVL